MINIKSLLFLSLLLLNCSFNNRPIAPEINPENFKHHINKFNAMEPEGVINYIPNSASWDWMKDNVPFFECPDKEFEEIYYFRWWTLRKHIKQTTDGFVLSEFITPIGHAGKHNTISCAFGHHAMESRWLQDRTFLENYIEFWLHKHDGGPQPHFHKYSCWFANALYQKYQVDGDKDFLIQFLPDLIYDFEQWHNERSLPNGLYWQYDVRDGMEESISGSRTFKNGRPTISSYMYANAEAISKIAIMAGKADIAKEFSAKAENIKQLIRNKLWDEKAKFFKVQFENGELSDAREEIGFVPWYFNIPKPGQASAWLQIKDEQGFKAPFGLTTAERRHPAFRSHGVGTCEWDGAVWPFATSQTLTGLANVLNNDDQSFVNKQDYFDALQTFAKAHHKRDKPHIGEYLDEQTGEWLKGDNPRSRYYNHSTFCDLIISGLVGLRPQAENIIKINPLVPQDSWDWFTLYNVNYHGKKLTIIWDKTGEKYNIGKGLFLFVNGELSAKNNLLEQLTASF